jgi:uncharacterized membrane protein
VSKGRIEAFSDGVFAIAITLLILEIKVPHPGERGLWHELAQLWPSYLAFFTSFLTIGIVWINHHAQFDRFAHVDRTLNFLNLFLLLWVSFVPFPTALVAEYLRDGNTSDQHTAATVYAATFLALSLTFFALWRYASGAKLLTHDLSQRQVAALTRRNSVGQIAYAISLGLAFVSATASLALCTLTAIYYIHPGRQIQPDDADPDDAESAGPRTQSSRPFTG